jgi:hypothetical protein
MRFGFWRGFSESLPEELREAAWIFRRLPAGSTIVTQGGGSALLTLPPPAALEGPPPLRGWAGFPSLAGAWRGPKGPKKRALAAAEALGELFGPAFRLKGGRGLTEEGCHAKGVIMAVSAEGLLSLGGKTPEEVVSALEGLQWGGVYAALADAEAHIGWLPQPDRGMAEKAVFGALAGLDPVFQLAVLSFVALSGSEPESLFARAAASSPELANRLACFRLVHARELARGGGKSAPPK